MTVYPNEKFGDVGMYNLRHVADLINERFGIKTPTEHGCLECQLGHEHLCTSGIDGDLIMELPRIEEGE